MTVTQYILICVVIIAMLTGIVSAKTPANGVGNMDGPPYDEWNLATDFWSDMINPINNRVEAKAYLRYDCDTNMVYLLVIDEDSPSKLIPPRVCTSIDSYEIPPDKIVWDYGNNYPWTANGYEAAYTVYSGYTYSRFLIENKYELRVDVVDIPRTIATVNYPLEITCDAKPSPEFPSTFLPVIMIIGILGTVFYIQRTREH